MQAITNVHEPLATAAAGSVIVRPVTASTLLVTTEPDAGPATTGVAVPLVWDPATVPFDATGVAAVIAVEVVDVADPALFDAVTSTS